MKNKKLKKPYIGLTIKKRMVKAYLLIRELFKRNILDEKNYLTKDKKNNLIHIMNNVCEIFENNSMEEIIIIMKNKEIGMLDYFFGRIGIISKIKKIEKTYCKDLIINKSNEEIIGMLPLEELKDIVDYLEEIEMNSVTDDYGEIIKEYRKNIRDLENLKNAKKL